MKFCNISRWILEYYVYRRISQRTVQTLIFWTSPR